MVQHVHYYALLKTLHLFWVERDDEMICLLWKVAAMDSYRQLAAIGQ
jgi:hypothetical protein